MHRARTRFSTRARRSVAILTTLALAAGLAGLTQANAATTVSPSESVGGQTIVRKDSIRLDVAGGFVYTRSNATANYTPQTNNLLIAASLCFGDSASTNRSPRSHLKVTGPSMTGPGEETVFEGSSPAKHVLSGAPQAPGLSSNYLGGAWWTNVSLAGRSPGIYTVTTTTTNKLRTTSLSGGQLCVDGTPKNVITPGDPANAFTAGLYTETSTFEYRPWQETFSDLLGSGTIQMNTDPKEFQFDVSGGSSPIFTEAAGAGAMKLYSVPNSASFQLSLPNPGACGTDPLGCLPTNAVSCDPGTGCVPRLVTINYDGGANKLTGLFDLDTRAFAAVAKTGGHTRVLLSGGTDVDAFLHSTLDQLNQMAAGLGIDLPALLGTAVDLNVQNPDGTTQVIRISLLRLIEIFEVPNGPATGISLLAPLSVGAGVITHFGTWLDLAHPLPADPALTEADGTQHSGFGYTITEATALPSIPSLPVPLNVLVPPGKLQHVVGKIPANSGGHLVAIGVDSDSDPATGLPLHLPLASTPGIVPDSGIDFIGTTVTAISAEACIPGFGCLGGAAMLGTGVATFGTSPLPINFGSIPLLWGDELGLGTVVAPLDTMLADLTTSVLTNPAVTDALGQLTPLLGGLPVPGLPGGGPPGGGLPLGNLPLGNLPLTTLLGSLTALF